GAVNVAYALNGLWRPPVSFEEADIGVDRIGDRADPTGALHHKLARGGLGLPVVEDEHSIGVAKVIGHPDLMKTVDSIADIFPCQPLAGAGERLAVAEMKEAGLERTVVRLPARIEPAAGGATLKGGVADGAGHGRSLSVCNMHAISVPKLPETRRSLM